MSRTTAILAAALLALGACKSSDKGSAFSKRDLGTGINTVDKQYGKPSEDVWNAAVSAAKSFDLKVEDDRHDAMGGTLVARRGDGEKVSIKVRSVDATKTDVGVRVEPGNRNMADMIHERIADKLGLKEAKSAFFGGNSLDATYNAPLGTCVAAAETTCRKLDLTITNRQVGETEAQIDAREQDQNPVQFRMKKADGKTKVDFIAGRERGDRNRAMSEKLKAEFDRHVTPQAD